MLQAFLKDDSGTTLIEYGLIAGLVSIAILVSVTDLGITVNDGFTMINEALAAATGTPDGVILQADVAALEPILDGMPVAIQ